MIVVLAVLLDGRACITSGHQVRLFYITFKYQDLAISDSTAVYTSLYMMLMWLETVLNHAAHFNKHFHLESSW